MRHATFLLLLLVLAACGPSESDRITMVMDPVSNTTTMRVPAPSGKVKWKNVARAVARGRGMDDSAFTKYVPSGSIQVDGVAGGLILAGLNQLLKGMLRFDLEPIEGTESSSLAIQLGRHGMLASPRRMKNLLLAAVERAQGAIFGKKGKYGFSLDESWDMQPKDRRLVILVHGLNSRPEGVGSILPAIRKLGLPVGSFAYPNDQSLEGSARLLAKELLGVKNMQPDRAVTLLTMSMGGLIARAVVEDPQVDIGNVRQLIMVAPPSHGSLLAEFSWAMEVWEFMKDDPKRKLTERFYSRIEDGFGQAGEDLRPESEFLKNLNVRTRNPKIRYSIMLGTKGTLTAMELEALRTGIDLAGDKNRFVRFFGSKMTDKLLDLDEVIDGKGDGAVAVRRGRLAGVTDTITLPFSHIGNWKDENDPAAVALRKAILERLN